MFSGLFSASWISAGAPRDDLVEGGSCRRWSPAETDSNTVSRGGVDFDAGLELNGTGLAVPLCDFSMDSV